MPSAVIRLQENATNSDVRVSDLLTQAKVIAKKLKLTEAVEWIEYELNGYPNTITPPSYRKAHLTVKAFNPFHGWIPVEFSNEKTATRFSTADIGTPISVFENTQEDSSYILENASLQHHLNQKVGMEVKRFLPNTFDKQLLSAVRQKVLDWSLELEGLGIMGDGLLFSAGEKETAIENKQVITNHFHGNISSSQIGNAGTLLQTNNNESTNPETQLRVREILEIISKHLVNSSLIKEDIQSLKKDIETIRHELEKETPHQPTVFRLLKGVQGVFEGVVGDIIASGIVHEIQKIVP